MDIIEVFINWIMIKQYPTDEEYEKYKQDYITEYITDFSIWCYDKLKSKDPLHYKSFKCQEKSELFIYPNSIRGLNFILKHCSCITPVYLHNPELRDHELHIYSPLIKNGTKRGGGLFPLGTIKYGSFFATSIIQVNINPNPYSKTIGTAIENNITINFEPIIEALARYRLANVSKYKIERFLMDTI